MLSVFLAVLRRDLCIGWRERGAVLHQLLFFVLLVALFPLAGSGSPGGVRTVMPGLIWMAALVATMLSLQRLFRPDYEDGTLVQYRLSPEPLVLIALAKVLAHWLVSGLLLCLAAPGVMLAMGASPDMAGAAAAALALGTPVLSLIGAIGTALTLSLPRGGLLLGILVFPLYVPVLIFGAGAMRAAALGLPVSQGLWPLAGVLLLAVATAPWAIAAALRIGVE
ncbi:heme exporter protein CcmB [Salinisphaera sp. SPP-AMP-43]|uniref:heme exporter protein CcmB n=1 Tax=Salinisphaera sp. SPP-AMP-43 TaxID=3121288 RepID=UPI003C6E6771